MESGQGRVVHRSHHRTLEAWVDSPMMGESEEDEAMVR